MSQRDDDVLKAVLADLVSDGNGPGKGMPVKYALARASKHLRFHNPQEVIDALTAGEQQQLITYTPGGISGLGNITLTDAGYAHATSRQGETNPGDSAGQHADEKNALHMQGILKGGTQSRSA